ncbi:hypothetical protein RR48_06683 [Papilio machaon]|uniref:Uncharacterized protein n=1 Tax=Papilio machaon TaxID=76193 RepID=A0A194R407_PAPMA|nr:hypothetical protein RR48_06683 [Papilio machaon]
MAAEFVEADWALSFIYPALGMGFVGMLVWLFLPSEPRHVGLVISPRPESRQSRRSEDEEEPSQVIVGDQKRLNSRFDRPVAAPTSFGPIGGPSSGRVFNSRTSRSRRVSHCGP